MWDLNATETLQLILAVLIGIAASLLIVSALWPFLGTLTRYMAHYRPKRVVLGDEDRGERGLLQIHSENDEPTFTGYWSLFRRVKRVEGTRGLWKGLGTFLIMFSCTVAMMLLLALVFTVFRLHLSPSLPFFALGLIIVIYIISIPVRVVVYRSLTTSRRLGFLEPLLAYKTLLFTRAERRNPLRLCLLPGLLISVILLDVESSIFSSVKETIGKALNYHRSYSWGSIGLSIGLSIVCSLLATPIEVVLVRLSVQEHSPGEFPTESLPAPETDVFQPLETEDPPAYQESQGIEFAGVEEDVINLRTDQEPYKGFVDCLRSIVREEGWGTLWRGWGIIAALYFLVDMDLKLLRRLT